MRNSLVFLILIISTSILELSFVNTFSHPFFLIPLTFSIGILMLHTLPVSYGVLWFIMTPFLFSAIGPLWVNAIPYIAVVIIGTILTMRVFTIRSIYALIGLGAILMTTFCSFQALIGISVSNQYSWIESWIFTNVALTILLIIGFTLIQKLKPIGALFITAQQNEY